MAASTEAAVAAGSAQGRYQPASAQPLPDLEALDTDGLLRLLIREIHDQTRELRALTNLLHDAIVGELIEP